VIRLLPSNDRAPGRTNQQLRRCKEQRAGSTSKKALFLVPTRFAFKAARGFRNAIYARSGRPHIATLSKQVLAGRRTDQSYAQERERAKFG